MWVELLTLWLQLRTWRSALYLVLGLPLGIVYFTFVVTAVSVSGGLLATIAGFPLLILTFVAVRYLIKLDAEIVGVLTGTDIVLPPSPWKGDATVWVKIKNTLTDRGTWRGYVYLLAMLPIGVMNFTITVLITAVGIYGATAWVWSQWEYFSVTWNGFYIREFSWTIETPVNVPWEIETIMVIGGVLLIITTPAMLIVLAHLQARFARYMLASPGHRMPNDSEPFDTSLQDQIDDEKKSRNRMIERKLFNEHAVLYVVINAIVIVFDFATGGDTWFFWVIAGWGSILAVHAATVFMPFFGEGWYEQKSRGSVAVAKGLLEKTVVQKRED